MKEKRTETAGTLARLARERYAGIYDPRELREAAQKDYLNKVFDTAQKGLKVYNKDFFVVSEAKREPLIPNIIRNFIFHRHSCPTPHYGQTVYMVMKDREELMFLWEVPDKEFAQHLRKNSDKYPEEYRDLIIMVQQFYSGELARKALLYNGEDVEIAKHVVIS